MKMIVRMMNESETVCETIRKKTFMRLSYAYDVIRSLIKVYTKFMFLRIRKITATIRSIFNNQSHNTFIFI